MECSELRTEFVGYIDGDLSDEERLRVELHIAQCYSCKEDLDELGRLLELSGAALKHPCPADRFEELKERLASAEPTYNPMPPRRKLRVREVLYKLAIAAIIIAVIAASPFLIRGAIRLFAPLEGTATLGNGADVDLLFRLPFIEQKLKVQQEVTEWWGAENEGEQTDRTSPTP